MMTESALHHIIITNRHLQATDKEKFKWLARAPGNLFSFHEERQLWINRPFRVIASILTLFYNRRNLMKNIVGENAKNQLDFSANTVISFAVSNWINVCSSIESWLCFRCKTRVLAVDLISHPLT